MSVVLDIYIDPNTAFQEVENRQDDQRVRLRVLIPWIRPSFHHIDTTTPPRRYLRPLSMPLSRHRRWSQKVSDSAIDIAINTPFLSTPEPRIPVKRSCPALRAVSTLQDKVRPV